MSGYYTAAGKKRGMQDERRSRVSHIEMRELFKQLLREENRLFFWRGGVILTKVARHPKSKRADRKKRGRELFLKMKVVSIHFKKFNDVNISVDQ